MLSSPRSSVMEARRHDLDLVLDLDVDVDLDISFLPHYQAYSGNRQERLAGLPDARTVQVHVEVHVQVQAQRKA
jgi:hypothetical protein